MAFANCCGVRVLKAPPSSPASGLPELEEPLLEELLLELEDPPLEELLPDPEEPERPDELPPPEELSAAASVASAAPLEEVEPQAVAPREAQINPHHSAYRMYTSLGIPALTVRTVKGGDGGSRGEDHEGNPGLRQRIVSLT
jgi:hypothetical protein